ncbi:MAG: hypothetical protein A3F84_16895 [Candidatus Handelsmanbacteria bacterium RIFCSPLOWO2_12_FULL_64_10]|uniref:Response regulatory domain-containing protein n=1 Tax=Handelsmanbacteria sp. (strain RIFCSPLOWO2_12_FULL_64_10) TaxID=1817868 RepID=A0A1F6CDP7_HANXR|nr:MAG: hypothetical protein A3F84_16895 [Candidatus Handelsmanbacteria bacterium RIFCSPLOWO2_12_FULL_64_10]
MATILFIDPSPRNRTQVERILRLRTEHTVVLAQDGVEAFECLRRGLPDLILMDLFLPRVDGFHVYRVLKERTVTARIPVILSTSVNLDPVTEARVRQLQLEGRVEMPVSSAELIEVISLVLLRQKPVASIRQEPVEGGPQGVTRVIWPRVEPPPPKAEPPPPAPKEVRPVVWPRAGSRQDPASQGPKPEGKGDPVPPLAPPKPSGRELRARLAMLATGQIKPDQDQETEGQKGVTGHESRVKKDSHGSRVTGQKNSHGSRVTSRESKKQPSKPGDPRLATQDSTDLTYEERVQALLRYVDKPPNASGAKSDAFQGIPLAQADPARVVDFTRKKKDSEKRSPEDPGDRPEAAPQREGRPSRSSEGEEQAPTIRPVQWSQIKKKE